MAKILFATVSAAFALFYLNLVVQSQPQNYLGFNNFGRVNSTPLCRPQLNHSGRHDLYVGCIRAKDKLIFNASYDRTGTWMTTRQKIVDYPGDAPKGHLYNDIITGIQVFDLVKDGKGGFASIKSGGVGNKLAEFEIERNKLE